MTNTITFNVRHTHQLTQPQIGALRTLLDVVYEGEFSPEDWDHALGGLHTLAWQGAQVIGHAAVVQRAVLVGNQPYRAGYLEAMGVHPDWQRRGVGRQLMRRVNTQVEHGYDLGLLSPSDEGRPLYAGTGWLDWLGERRSFTPGGVTPTPDEEVMVYGRADLGLDLTQPLTCDYRSGDVW
ncbi:GNAT family N-acetyltransferase [Deinococcus fonticola]|uniref:GNAT family N-acetyltransferase n=1 Tax=Deinococcus fonticola TaxID=2528713 RepID=UPI00107526AB|nr:GNAT family N-acetyltransferase [Deinococcus fonticola]